MKPLGDSYSKNTFYYELVVRSGDIAIFKQRLRPGEGCLAYEVIKVQKHETYVIKDKKKGIENVILAHEGAPGNEQWGTFGWTYPTLERAKEKYHALLALDSKVKILSKDSKK
jgi:ASC-1-like (ASCH) protein